MGRHPEGVAVRCLRQDVETAAPEAMKDAILAGIAVAVVVAIYWVRHRLRFHTTTDAEEDMYMSWLSILKTVGPYAALAIPGAGPFAPLIPVIIGAIGEAEAIKGATGPEKKAHVVAIAKAATVTINATAGKQVVDPSTVAETTDAIVDAAVGATNVIQQVSDSKAETPAGKL